MKPPIKIIEECLLKTEKECLKADRTTVEHHYFELGEVTLKEALKIVKESKKDIPEYARLECGENNCVELYWSSPRNMTDKEFNNKLEHIFCKQSFKLCESELKKGGYIAPISIPFELRLLFSYNKLKNLGVKEITKQIIALWQIRKK